MLLPPGFKSSADPETLLLASIPGLTAVSGSGSSWSLRTGRSAPCRDDAVLVLTTTPLLRGIPFSSFMTFGV